MPIIFSGTIIQLLIALTLLAVITCAAIYCLSLLRVNSLQKKQSADDLLNSFRELQLKGKLSDAEFRIIKKQIASQTINSLKDSDVSDRDHTEILRLLAQERACSVPNGQVRDSQDNNEQDNNEETKQWSGDSGDTILGC